MPSAHEMIEEVERRSEQADVNSLHQKAYELMCKYKSKYYDEKANEFLSRLDISEGDKKKVRGELLRSVDIDGKKYDNIMEEISRRISQSFQPLSGTLAELCVERELNKVGLKKNIHYSRRKNRTDFTIYYPNLSSHLRFHRVEVKNVSLRERGLRSLSFDGDSLFGFFNQPEEFSKDTMHKMDEHCQKTGGYCYLPPETLKKMVHGGVRFRENTRFGADMELYVTKGSVP